MNLRTIVVIALCSMSLSSMGQGDAFSDAFEEFASSRLWEFEEIPLDWKMEGLLQADLNEGLNFLLEGQYTQADATLSIVIEKEARIWQAFYYRAAARKFMRNFSRAQSDMEQVLQLRGDFYEGFVEMAKILHLRGQTIESERAINKAIRLDRKRGTAYYLKGDIDMSQGTVNKAINNYRECLSNDSLFHPARIKLALLDAMAKKKVSGALSHLDKVLLYDSLQKDALLFRSILNSEADKKQSVKDLTSLLKVSPEHLMALYLRGIFSAELGDYERGFADFQKVIRTTSTSDNNFVGKQSWLDKKIDLQNAGEYTLTRVYGLPDDVGSRIKEAYCHIATQKYDESIRAIDQIPNHRREPVAVYLKAVAFEHKGAHIHALQNYNFAIALDDQIADAYKKRGIYEQEMKEWDKSVSDFNAVLRIYPDAFLINRMRGVSYYHLNRFQEAAEDFNTYLKNDSTNKEVMGFRGMAYVKSGESLKAYVDFARSKNHAALNFRHMEKLVDSLLVLKDTVQALYCLDAITEEAPYFSEGYVQKFKIHMARNEWTPIEEKIWDASRNVRQDVYKPHQSYLLTVLAMSLARNRHTDDAIKTLGDAIKLDKNNDLAYLARGRLFVDQNKSSKAVVDLKKASELGNRQAEALLAGIK